MTLLHAEEQQPTTDVKENIITDAQKNTETNTQQQIETPDQHKNEPKHSETPEDPNWKAFREARKKDRAEREAAERRASEKENEVAALKAAMEAAFTKQSAPSTQAYQQYYGMNQGHDQTEETEEQRIKRLVNEQIAQREEVYKKQAAEHEQREYPNRLRRDFPDFSQVCSQENLDYLDFHYPEISRPLQRLGEGYDKWSDTYHAVKKLIPNHSMAKKDAMRADINNNKPRSISSTGPSPTGNSPPSSWQEIESKRAENWARMQRTMKGV